MLEERYPLNPIDMPLDSDDEEEDVVRLRDLYDPLNPWTWDLIDESVPYFPGSVLAKTLGF